MDKINIAEKFSLFSEQWSPKIVGQINDFYLKLVKIKGEFIWHSHSDEDELFLVVKGRLTMKLKDKDVVLEEGECFIVPKTIEHCPVAEEETHLLLLEPKSVLNTGDKLSDKTIKNPEWI